MKYLHLTGGEIITLLFIILISLFFGWVGNRDQSQPDHVQDFNWKFNTAVMLAIVITIYIVIAYFINSTPSLH